jgi:3-isopropylmalate dehydrogenase
MLLAWYGRRKKARPFQAASAVIEKSVEAAIAAKESTADIGGRLGTRETGDAVAARVQTQK